MPLENREQAPAFYIFREIRGEKIPRMCKLSRYLEAHNGFWQKIMLHRGFAKTTWELVYEKLVTFLATD
jgi:hypothetical protein